MTGLLVVVKVAICVFTIVAGAWFVTGANLTPFVPPGQPVDSGGRLAQPLISLVAGLDPAAFGIGGILTAAAVVFFSYTGFETVANLSEETRRPGRDLPLGLPGTLAVSTLLHVGVTFVVVGMVKYTDIDEGAPIADAFGQNAWASALISATTAAWRPHEVTSSRRNGWVHTAGPLARSSGISLAGLFALFRPDQPATADPLPSEPPCSSRPAWRQYRVYCSGGQGDGVAAR